MKKTYKYNTDDEPAYKYPIFWVPSVPVVAVIIGACFWTQGNDNALVMLTNVHYKLTRPTATAYRTSKLNQEAKVLGTEPAKTLTNKSGLLNKLHSESGKTIYNYHAKGLPEMIRIDNPRNKTTKVYLYDMKSEYGTLGKKLYEGKLAR